MNPGDKVDSPLGLGTIIKRESSNGILSHRFLIKMDKFPLSTYFGALHREQGGLYFLEESLHLVKKKDRQIDLTF